MKRINYLFALALPALMAACTQEELVTSDASNNGMNLVENPIENFSLKVNIEDKVGTRMVGNDFEVGDQMALVWFNPWYSGGKYQLDSKDFYANNRMTLSKNANGEGVWTSDAVIMEGTHFAYLPFQTVWENQKVYPLQVKGGQEALQVYNETDQKDDESNRLYWAYNHATYLSPAYEFTADDGTAGISDDRRIDMRIFSNRLSFTPVFENAPADLTVYSYELKAVGSNNTHVYPFVTHAEILAHKLPKSGDFHGCDWATLNTTTKLSEFYNPVKFAESLTMTYANEVKASGAPQFMFLLLPNNKDKVVKPGAPAYVKAAGKIVLVAKTNYGDITIETVEGKFDANTTKVGEITLSKLYYNGDDISQVESANTYVGFVDVAGTTRGATTGFNGALTATFDFNTIKRVLPEVCSNATLNRALQMIKNYKRILGDTYTEQKIVLCKQPTFTNLAFTEKIEAIEKATGVEITVTGKEWTDDKGNQRFSEITWEGKSKLDQVIPYTENFVADGATLTTNSEKNIVKITVLKGGKLANKGLVSTVIVEEGGSATNDGTITSVTNYGKVTNNQAVSAAPEDQPTIERLYNYNSVVNYATLSDVRSNVKADKKTAATIELRDNTKKVGLGTLGSIFVVNAKNAEDDGKLGIIKYDLDSATAADAGTDLTNALNNYATQITVDAAVTKIAAPESKVFKNGNSTTGKNDFDRVQITFEGNTEYSIDNSTAVGSLLALGEIVLKDGVTLTVSNAYYTGNNSGATVSAYALVADELTMGNNAVVDVKEITTVVAAALNIADGMTATVKTVPRKEMLSEFYYGTKFGNGILTTSGNICTEIPQSVKKYTKK